METEMQHMDMGDMPVESTTGVSDDEQLMYTTSDDGGNGVEYQSTIGDVSAVSDLSSAEVAGIMAFVGVYLVFVAVLVVFSIVTMWKVFTKAGRAGWESIVPIYNVYITLLIIGRPGWWILLLFIPFVNLVIALLIAIDLAKSFGRSATFGVVGLFLFSIVGYAILAFGSDKYIGPVEPNGALNPNQNGASDAPEAPPAAPAV